MLSSNMFYSGFNILFGILSIFVGFGSVFFIRNSANFKGMLFFQLGGLALISSTYLVTNDYILYKLGFNYNFISFIFGFLALLISVLWLNSASELYNNKTANWEMLTLYISLGLSICLYYAFLEIDGEQAHSVYAVFTILSLSLLLFSGLLCLARDFSVGYILFNTALLMLLAKLIISAYFFEYSRYNLNILTWLWMYVFAAAMVFIKFDLYKDELQKSQNDIDKLNIQINKMVDLSPFPIVIARITDNRLLLANEKAEVLFGFAKKEMNYHKLEDFFVDETNRLQFFNLLKQTHEIEYFDLMVCNIINSSPFWLSVSAQIIEYNNEMALYMAFQDITLRKQRETSLQLQAQRDSLTMAWNRRYFETEALKRIEDSIKNSQNFSLLLLDADKFKRINDTYGHKTGDKVLIELAEICRKSLRDDDMVVRFGGEEFVVYLSNTNTEGALSVAERLRKTIENASVKSEDGELISFTVSIGVVSSENTSSLEVLLRQVDDAMYLAKHNGRNQVAVYDEKMVNSALLKKHKKVSRNVHPVFKNEETEEISLLDNYDSKMM